MPTTPRKPIDEPARARERRARVVEKFVPSIDLFHLDREALAALSAEDKQRVIEAKVADVTHFHVGLQSLGQTLDVARDLILTVRPLPTEVRGQLVQPSGQPVDRLAVEPALPDGRVLGRGVVTGEDGVFALPMPELTADDKTMLRRDGLGLRVTGGNGREFLVVGMPSTGGGALGILTLGAERTPLPRSVVAALVDLADGLGSVVAKPDEGTTAAPVQVKLGQDTCGIVFEEDTAVRRFGYKVLVRLVEPRTTTVTRVGFQRLPQGRQPGVEYSFPLWDEAWVGGLSLTRTGYVDRVPIDKPIGVDRFRDGIIGLQGERISAEQRVPVAGTLGLGYVLNLAQVWKYQGLTLGNLVYSLPLAPGEQQRIAVSERVSTATVREAETLEAFERQQAALREESSAQAVFSSAFEEHVTASSHYSNEARSSSWGVAGGIGAVLGPVAVGVGAGGGAGKSSNSGNTGSALDGVRTSTNEAAESMHRSVESEASGRRQLSRSSIRLARETETQTVTTKVIANHNKAHALTIQYWEVLRKFAATTEVEGTTLVCFVPLDIVRFLPAGQPLEISDTTVVDQRDELLDRYSLLHRHADAIQSWLPGKHREGLRLLEDFFGNPRTEVAIDGPASDTLDFSLRGTFVPYETVWVTVLLRGGRRLRRVALATSLVELPPETIGSRSALVGKLQGMRNDESSLTQATASMALPATVDRGDIVGFEIERSFRELTYQLDMTQNPTYQAFKDFENNPILTMVFKNVQEALEASVTLTPAQLEGELGGPVIKDFSVKIQGETDTIEGDRISSLTRFNPGPMLIAAIEQNSPLRYRDLLKIERTLQHVVRNTMTYSKAVWSSLTAEERVVMLEGYTIGLPDTGLDADSINDASQHIPLLNCVANKVLGYYGNSMILPFSIPAALATSLATTPAEAVDDEEEPASLTTGAVQDALTAFHKSAFSPPTSHFTLPTKGVLGEAVLGNCPSAEKIDLTRFWNWQDSPSDEATAIEGVTLRDSTVAQLAAPATLAQVPSVINIAPGQGGTLQPGTLAATLAAEASKQQPFSTDFLGHDVLKALGQETIKSAESARADALGKATQMASQAMAAAVDVHKAQIGVADKAKQEAEDKKKVAEDKKKAEEKAATATVDAAVKNLKDNAKSYLAAADAKPDLDTAKALATAVLGELNATEIPMSKAVTLFGAYDQHENGARTQGSTAWLTVLGLLSE